MSLHSLGFGPFQAAFSSLSLSSSLHPARVIAAFGSQLAIAGVSADRAELSGRLRRELDSLARPTTGDWVAVALSGDLAIVHHVLPRQTQLVRRAAGTREEPQVVAANIATVFVVTSANRDANPRRLERYLAAIRDGGAAPVVIVNKIDLGAASDVIDQLAAVAPGVPVLAASAHSGAGIAELAAMIAPATTAAFVGMSGVGKSSLVNRLLASERQVTLPIDADDRGRHATTRRELLVLPNGGMIIDTPGMRSFGLEDATALDDTFADIGELAARCRFRDCQHAGEPGCAVAAAIDDGELDPARVAAQDKLARELARVERRRASSVDLEAKQRMRAINRALRTRYRHDPKGRG